MRATNATTARPGPQKRPSRTKTVQFFDGDLANLAVVLGWLRERSSSANDSDAIREGLAMAADRIRGETTTKRRTTRGE